MSTAVHELQYMNIKYCEVKLCKDLTIQFIKGLLISTVVFIGQMKRPHFCSSCGKLTSRFAPIEVNHKKSQRYPSTKYKHVFVPS